jgi:hypothetical protein
MKPFHPNLLAGLVAAAVALLVAGCVSSASDGRYQTNPRGGWDNFRAEAPALQRLAWCVT